MGAEDCTFFHFSHQVTEETCSKQVVVGTFACHFQVGKDVFVLNQFLPHRFIMGIPGFIYQIIQLTGCLHHGVAYALQVVHHQLLVAKLTGGIQLSGNLRQGGQMENEVAQGVVVEVGIQKGFIKGLAVCGPFGKQSAGHLSQCCTLLGALGCHDIAP